MDSHPVSTPVLMEMSRLPGGKIKVPYRSVIGSLNYLVLISRPDLCYNVLSRQNQDEVYESDWASVKRVLRYIKGTQDLGIEYTKSEEIDLNVYVDASFGSEKDKKSLTGYAIFLGNNLITWKTKKQNTVSLSTVEAE
jgi:hypothetical protein